jgi:hypothetical protein
MLVFYSGAAVLLDRVHVLGHPCDRHVSLIHEAFMPCQAIGRSIDGNSECSLSFCHTSRVISMNVDSCFCP